MEERAYAKINLALHVRARASDGYHRIETLFAFAEEGDRLAVGESDGLTLALSGPFAAALKEEDDNLVLRAAAALRRRYGVTRGAALRLDKRLPVAAGIGGGSADAAAALRLLVRWWALPAEQGVLTQIAAGLGADVPACLMSRTARGEGRGERLRPADDALAGLPLLLVNPGVPVSTAAVFRSWDGVDRGSLPVGPPLEVAHQGRNDLEPAALPHAPAVAAVLRRLRQAEGALLARMSGSGATCFALFAQPELRDTARDSIAAAEPAWWQLATRLR